MKYSLLIYLISIIGCSSAQQTVKQGIPVDSLKKYSYFIAGFEIVNPATGEAITSGGTCFFLKEKDELYLTTAKHVMTGCDSIKAVHYPSILNVFSPNYDNLISIETKPIRDTAACLPFYADPDVIVIKVSNKIQVNVVNDFMLEPFLEVGNTVIYGFPGINNIKPSGFRIVPADSIMLKENSYSYVSESINNHTDTINYHIYAEHYTFDYLGKGYSGSPVFVQDKLSKKWRVAGIAVGYALTTTNKTFLYVTHSIFINQKINNH
jgi:hypothetical protein